MSSSSSASRTARSPHFSTMLLRSATRLRSGALSAVISCGVLRMTDLSCSSAAVPGSRRSCRSCAIARRAAVGGHVRALLLHAARSWDDVI